MHFLVYGAADAARRAAVARRRPHGAPRRPGRNLSISAALRSSAPSVRRNTASRVRTSLPKISYPCLLYSSTRSMPSRIQVRQAWPPVTGTASRGTGSLRQRSPALSTTSTPHPTTDARDRLGCSSTRREARPLAARSGLGPRQCRNVVAPRGARSVAGDYPAGPEALTGPTLSHCPSSIIVRNPD